MYGANLVVVDLGHNSDGDALHAHRRTNIENVAIVDQGRRMMSHVGVTACWEVGEATPVAVAAKR